MEAPNCGWHYKTFGMDFCDAPPLGGGGILGVAIGEWAAPRKPRMRGRVADQGGRGAARRCHLERDPVEWASTFKGSRGVNYVVPLQHQGCKGVVNKTHVFEQIEAASGVAGAMDPCGSCSGRPMR